MGQLTEYIEEFKRLKLMVICGKIIKWQIYSAVENRNR